MNYITARHHSVLECGYWQWRKVNEENDDDNNREVFPVYEYTMSLFEEVELSTGDM